MSDPQDPTPQDPNAEPFEEGVTIERQGEVVETTKESDAEKLRENQDRPDKAKVHDPY